MTMSDDPTPLFLPILLGTVREGRESEKVARLLLDRMSRHPEIETKRALDVLLTEYVHRAVGLVGVSAGGFGGVRAIEKLVGVVRSRFDARARKLQEEWERRVDRR